MNKNFVYRKCIKGKKVKSAFFSFSFYVTINMFCQSEVAVYRDSVNQKQLFTDVLQKQCS